MSSHDDETRELREQVEKLKAENARLDEFCMGCLEKIGNQQMLLARVRDELKEVSTLFETINKEINGEPWEEGIQSNSEGKYAECLIKIDRYEQDRAKIKARMRDIKEVCKFYEAVMPMLLFGYLSEIERIVE
jgi:DNA repair exonuclease SbcCD ATPase subunit